VRHESVTCNECEENGIRGIRWKCLNCDDYNLCSSCYHKDKHIIEHVFKRIKSSSDEG
ncbi:E3 ubiquitin-protein ligase MIB2, partial [Biomphalaria pfeifferi]